MGSALGKALGRYVLDALVARGACGEVYRGRDLQTGQRVAVKRLRDEYSVDSIVAQRFEREARMLAEIENVNVVRYLGHGPDEDSRPCLVLEWVEGEDLAGRVKRGPLPLSLVVEVARQAAQGLGALHSAGIVHRDVKPSNFLVSLDCDERELELDPELARRAVRTKLIDLGIARAPADPVLTIQGNTIGTPAYMSPEQARGDELLTLRSDLFSLGVVVYELLSRKKPFGGENPFVLLAKVVLEEPPRLATIMPGLPAELDELVARAMAKSPDARFGSARELVAALSAIRVAPGALEPGETDFPTQQIRLEPLSPSAERRVVTAVFALFRGGDELVKDMASFERAAREQRATVHRTLGGRMIAVFGAERSSGDEPMRAARTALAAAARISGVRLAIATGRVVAGVSGLSGEAIERGARNLEQGRAGVRIDSPTARLLSGQFLIDGAEGEGVLRGERGAIEVSRTLLGKPTRCWGRDRELGTLQAIWQECLSEPRARAVVVTAPAGGGKSRVRYEFMKRLEQQGSGQVPEILFARGDPLGAGSPFGMVASAVRRAAAILDGEPGESQQQKLFGRVARSTLQGQLERVVAFLGELANVPFPDEASPVLRAARRDAVLMGDAMRAAWVDWLSAECAAHPVLLVLEDLQWGDVPTVKFVDAALRALADAPFMVLALARPEVSSVFSELWAERNPIHLPLDELSPKAAAKLVHEALGDELSEATLRLVVERGHGNPFFLEELIRAVAEGKTADLPDTVLGMVQARLDTLGAEARRVLRAASVFGATFWRGGVRALLGEDPAYGGLSNALEELAQREVITPRPEARFPGETEYHFRHSLVGEAAYVTLLEGDRALAHRLAGQWLERMGETDAAVLAEHFDRGEEPVRAAHWYRRGAEQALEGNDLSAVLQRAERGLSLCAGGETLGALRLAKATALGWTGEMQQAQESAMEAADHLVPGTAAWFCARSEIIFSSGRLGRLDEVKHNAQIALDCEPATGAESARIRALSQGVVSLLVGDHDVEAAALVERLEKLAADGSRLDPAAIAQVHRARAYLAYYADDLSGAAHEFEATIGAFERASDVRNACLQQTNLGYLYCELGQYESAERIQRSALAAGERMGVEEVVGGAVHNLGLALLHLGKLGEARRIAARATQIYHRQRDPRLECTSRYYVARVALQEGDSLSAEREARIAANLLSTAHTARSPALAALALALLAQGRGAEAESAAREAVQIVASSQRFVEGEPFSRLALAEVLHAANDHNAAQAVIVKATHRLLERAKKISDQRLRASFLERVPEHARTLELMKEWGAPGGAPSLLPRNGLV